MTVRFSVNISLRDASQRTHRWTSGWFIARSNAGKLAAGHTFSTTHAKPIVVAHSTPSAFGLKSRIATFSWATYAKEKMTSEVCHVHRCNFGEVKPRLALEASFQPQLRCNLLFFHPCLSVLHATLSSWLADRSAISPLLHHVNE